MNGSLNINETIRLQGLNLKLFPDLKRSPEFQQKLQKANIQKEAYLKEILKHLTRHIGYGYEEGLLRCRSELHPDEELSAEMPQLKEKLATLKEEHAKFISLSQKKSNQQKLLKMKYSFTKPRVKEKMLRRCDPFDKGGQSTSSDKQALLLVDSDLEDKFQTPPAGLVSLRQPFLQHPGMSLHLLVEGSYPAAQRQVIQLDQTVQWLHEGPNALQLL
ncbi:unnamed protein product [Arctogadus glacialis]